MDKSDYFSSMFSGRFTDANTTSKDLSNCMHEIDELNTVLDYMYSGNITLSEKNISYVLSLASLFLLGELKAACAEFLMANLVPSTCIPIFVLADKFFLQKVRAGCLEVIKAWFPFYICNLKEAFEMSPDFLQVLVKEKVFELLPDDVKKTFVQEWHKHFLKASQKATPLPKEVSDLLKEVAALPKPSTSSGIGQPSVNEREEMLFTVVMPHGTYSRRGFDECSNMRGIEVLAFSPKRKAWKSVLRHIFTKGIYESTRHPDKVRDLIGVNETTAFFRFEHKAVEPKGNREWNDDDQVYVVTVNLKTKAESVINIPDALILSHAPHNYFLWEGRLCAFYSEDCHSWNLYFNDDQNKCKIKCEGDCWEKICLLPKHSMHIDSDQLVTKAFCEDLFVGLVSKEACKSTGGTTSRFVAEDCRRVLVFCISPKNNQEGEKWQVTELPSPGAYKTKSSPFSFEEKIVPKFFCISNPEASLLTFQLRFEAASFKETVHRSMNFIYDVEKKEWRKKQSGKVVYPEVVPRVLEMSRKIQNTGLHGGLQESEVYLDGFLARSSSPFNTSILKKEKGVWQLVTHLPCPLSSLAFMKRAVCRVGFFQTLPNASFVDWSRETGQSPIVTLTTSKMETDFELQFETCWMQSFWSWERKWADKQQGPGDPLSESESESSDDDYMYYRPRKMRCAYASSHSSDDDDDIYNY